MALMATLAAGCVDPGPAYDWGKSPDAGPSRAEPRLESDASAAEEPTPASEQEPSIPLDASDTAASDGESDAGLNLDAGALVDAADAAPGRRQDASSSKPEAGADAAKPDANAVDASVVDDSVFAGANVCTSRMYWRGGDRGSEEMSPGRACITCHRDSDEEEKPPIFSLAGTLYPTGHEPDDCYGAHPGGATIHVVDARGVTLDLAPNAAGNFTTQRAFSFPLSVSVVYQGRVRAMEGPVERDQGDCNTCHSAAGTKDAPGRIVLP
jgi:hypothetical protein